MYVRLGRALRIINAENVITYPSPHRWSIVGCLLLLLLFVRTEIKGELYSIGTIDSRPNWRPDEISYDVVDYVFGPRVSTPGLAV